MLLRESCKLAVALEIVCSRPSRCALGSQSSATLDTLRWRHNDFVDRILCWTSSRVTESRRAFDVRLQILMQLSERTCTGVQGWCG